MGSSYAGGWATGPEARPCPRSSLSAGIVGLQPEPGGGSLRRAGGARREAWGVGDTELARLRTDMPSKRHSGSKASVSGKRQIPKYSTRQVVKGGRWEAGESLAGKMLWAPGGLSLDPTPALQRRRPQRGPGRAGAARQLGQYAGQGRGVAVQLAGGPAGLRQGLGTRTLAGPSPSCRAAQGSAPEWPLAWGPRCRARGSRVPRPQGVPGRLRSYRAWEPGGGEIPRLKPRRGGQAQCYPWRLRGASGRCKLPPPCEPGAVYR